MCAAPLQSTAASGATTGHLFIEGLLPALITGAALRTDAQDARLRGGVSLSD
jgi:hypothetical protein